MKLLKFSLLGVDPTYQSFLVSVFGFLLRVCLSGLLGLFPAFSRAFFGPFVGFWEPFRACGPLPNLFWASGPLLGLLTALSGPRASSGPTLNLNPTEHPVLPLPSLFFGLFLAFWGLFPAFSGPRAFSEPFLGFWTSSPASSGLFWLSGPFPSLFWAYLTFLAGSLHQFSELC